MSDIKRINVNGSGSVINPDYNAKLNHTDASLFTAETLLSIAGYNPANGINMQNAVDVLAKKHSKLESKAEKAAYITESESDSDLDIGDSEGNVLARFSDGHFQTLNFDSSVVMTKLDGLHNDVYTKYDDSLSSLNIGDIEGNVLVKFSNGHIKTQNFDSRKKFAEIQVDNSLSELNIGDDAGNVLVKFIDGHIKTQKFDSSKTDDSLDIRLNIQDFTTYVGDTVQIFKYPLTLMPNYNDYGINIFMDSTNNNVKKLCKCLERYAEIKPTSTGVYPMKVNVAQPDGKILIEKSFNMTVVAKPSNPSTVKNVLCIGDSITLGQRNNSGVSSPPASEPGGVWFSWCEEVKNYLSSRSGDDTTPAGLNLSNVRLIGSQNTSKGRHEGYGGWNVLSFLGSSSPFYVGGKIDFDAYFAKDSIYDDPTHKGIDLIYMMLGANGGCVISKDNNNKIVYNTNTFRMLMKSLLNKIKEQIIEGEGTYANPNCKVILLSYWMPWVNGWGYHPYGSDEFRDGPAQAYSFIEMFYTGKEISEMDEYKSFVTTSICAPFIDSENAYVYMMKNVNKRMNVTEKIALEQVHPNTLGYLMTGEAVVRDIIGRL